MQADEVLVYVDGRAIRVPAGASAVAALVLAGQRCTRLSVSSQARFAVCGMGQCQECRVTIDGREHRLACQVRCHSGMSLRTGAAEPT
jgi:predicted molibdopterin-dependent oxidoreductase YjgC